MKIISSPQAFGLSNYKITKAVTSPTSCTYSATAYGGVVIGASGLRLWDTNVLPASGTLSLTPTSPLILPLIDTNLPTTKFDAIIDLIVDGNSYPLAFSNCADNIAAYNTSQTIAPTNIFWVNLLRVRPNANPYPAESPAYDYYFGGDAVYYDGFGSSQALKLNLAQPLIANTTFSYTLEYFGASSTSLTPTSGTINLTSATPTRNIVIGSFPTGQLGQPNGYYKMIVTCSDPSFKSLLPVYHFGCYA